MFKRLRRKPQQLVTAVPWVSALDRHRIRVADNRQVTRPRASTRARGRDGAGVDDEQILKPPRIWNMFVARQNKVDFRSQQALNRVSGVVNDVALPAGPGDRPGAQRRS